MIYEEDFQELKPQEKMTFQLDFGSFLVSFIARSGEGYNFSRKEFLLGSFESVTFLAAKVGDLTDLQLRVACFQLDNNIDSDGR